MERSRALSARLVGLALGTMVMLVVALPAGNARATAAPDCLTVASIPLAPATGVTCSVGDEASLTSILEQIDTAYAAYTRGTATAPSTTTIDFTQGIQLTSDLPFVNGPVVINGEGYALTSQENGGGVPMFRGLLLYNSDTESFDCGGSLGNGACSVEPGTNGSGTATAMTVENLTIADTAAQGGNGGNGAGGGAGLGGAIFVGNGVELTLSGDSFSNNSAIGGNGGLYNDPTLATGFGGGGGMGGAGGNGGPNGYDGGGGGLGAGASGGSVSGSVAGGAGIAYGLGAGGWGDSTETLGSCPSGTNAGGAAGGGGGAGGSNGQGGGGGGLAGDGNPATDANSCGFAGGIYGIGGGGGGGAPGPAWGGLGGGMGFVDSQVVGEDNGFGGGAAGATANSGTPGSYASSDSNQGFAAGNGVNNGTGGNNNATDWMGGGGAGVGGAVFVQQGATVVVTGTLTESGASVAGGSGACSGSVCAGNGRGLGGAIFLEGDGATIGTGPYQGAASGSALSFSPAAGQTETLGDGVLDESAVDAGDQQITPWTLTMNGAGTLDLEGNDQFGATQLNAGTLVVPASASLASKVTINSGATMILAGTVSGNVTLNSGGLLCTAQAPTSFTDNGGTVTSLSNCSTPPTATIGSPAGGGTYTVGQVVGTSFQCSPGLNAVLSSCRDSNGVSGGQNGSITDTLNTSAPGVYTYTVTATDGDGKTATASLTYTVSSPCKQTVAFGLVQLTVPTGGCLQPSANGDTYTTPGPLTMNGLTLPALPAGAEYVASEPTTGSPGGSLAVQAPAVNVSLPLTIGGSDGVTFDLGAFTWKLPAAPSGGVGYATVQQLTLAPKQVLKGLQIGASAAMNIGKDSGGAYYTSFDFTVQLPSMFKSGPAGNAAGLTGSASVRVDAQGAHFNGLAIEVTNAYIGTLQVKSACFAYLPDGPTGTTGCPAPAVPATPLPTLSCSAAGGDSWIGSADIVLPTTGAPDLSLYGSIAGGTLEGLSAQASNLKIELADDVFLTSVGVSLCLPNSTEPFRIQGTVQLGAIQQGSSSYLVNINGSFGYTDPFQGQPWTLDVGGEVTVGGEDVGSGAVSFYGSSYLYFEVSANLDLASIATLEGYIEGWLEMQSPYQFNVQGGISLYLEDIGSFNGSGAVSSVGASGCATVGGISYWVPEKDSDWEWYEPWLIHWVEETVTWQAGFGYYWGASSPTIWGASCDIGNYELSAPAGIGAAARAHSAAANTGFEVQNARSPMAVRINGAGGAPVVKITMPSGRVIAPPAGGRIGEKIPGIGMLLENKRGDATMVLLTAPAKGSWRVTPVSGSVRVTSIETAKVLPPPEVVGAARPLASGKVGLGVAYSLAAGEKMTLYAAGPHHSQQVIGVVKGKRCAGARHAGPSSQLCEHLSFTPIYGPSGKRTIYAAVTNARGLPVATVKLASFRLRFPKPAAVKPAILRRGTRVRIEWLPVLDASKYALSVVLGDGRKLSYTLHRTSKIVRGLTRTDSVKATVWPVMPDGVIGRSAGATLRRGANRTGSKPKHKHRRRLNG